MSNILETISHAMLSKRIEGLKADDVKNAFFANYLASLVMMRLQDLKGLLLVNDKHHSKLTKYTPQMSSLNFWGRTLFYANDAEVKHMLAPGEADVIVDQIKNINDHRIQYIMDVPHNSPESTNWDEVVTSLLLLRQRLKLNSSYFYKIVNMLYNWPTVTDNDRLRTIGMCVMYLLQSDQKSKLLPRLREVNNRAYLTGSRGVSMRYVSFKKIVEDEGGGDGGETSVGNIATGDNMNFNAIVTPAGYNLDNQYTTKKGGKDGKGKKKGKYKFKGSKIIIKKEKRFKMRKFKAPDFLKPNSKNVYGSDGDE